MKILITGGAGFIGSRYVRNILNGNYPGYESAEVTVLDKLTYAGRRDNLPENHPRLSFVHGDICDKELLRELLPAHDTVVHFAAESHVDRSLTDASHFITTNVGGTQSLMDACLDSDVETILHISTDEVYGSISTGSWSEREPLFPTSPYAASKAGSDLIALSYWRTYGMNVRVTRCSNNYGPRQNPEKFIPHFIINLLSGRSVPLYGNGKNVREWLHVDDHCRALQLVLDYGNSGEIYNIGSGSALSNYEVTDRLLKLCGRSWDAVQYVEDRPGHDLRYSVDDSRIRDNLGYVPQWEFEEGLAETVSWYRENTWFWEHLLK